MRYRSLLAALACASIPLSASAQDRTPVAKPVTVTATVAPSPSTQIKAESPRAKSLRLAKEKSANAAPLVDRVSVAPEQRQQGVSVKKEEVTPIRIQEPGSSKVEKGGETK